MNVGRTLVSTTNGSWRAERGNQSGLKRQKNPDLCGEGHNERI